MPKMKLLSTKSKAPSKALAKVAFLLASLLVSNGTMASALMNGSHDSAPGQPTTVRSPAAQPAKDTFAANITDDDFLKMKALAQEADDLFNTIGHKAESLKALKQANPNGGAEVTAAEDELYQLILTNQERLIDLRHQVETTFKHGPTKEQLLAHIEWLRTSMHQATPRIDAEYIHKVHNPRTLLDEYISGQFSMDTTAATPEKQDHSTHLPSNNFAGKAGAAVAEFGSAYAGYNLAQGLINLSELGLQNLSGAQAWDQTNPMKMQKFLEGLVDPLGATGFAVFMMVNHPVMKALQGVKAGRIPVSFIPYIGMSAGMLAQSIFTEAWSDEAMHQCARATVSYDISLLKAERVNLVNGDHDLTPAEIQRLKEIQQKLQPLDEKCAKAYNSWQVHNLGLKYAPSIASMIGATVLSGEAGKMLFGSTPQKQIQTQRFIARRFFWVSKASFERLGAEGLKDALKIARGLTGFTLSVGNFVLFLAIDQVISPKISSAWSYFTTVDFDPKALFDEAGLHSELIFPSALDRNHQAIDNAFDVRATSLHSAHDFMIKMFKTYQENRWTPLDINECQRLTSESKYYQTRAFTYDHLVTSNGLPYNLFGIVLHTLLHPAPKSAAQLDCEVMAQPVMLISKFQEQNQKFRDYLLSDFKEAQSNWMELISDFGLSYQVQTKMGAWLTDSKTLEVVGEGQRPDFSQDKLRALVREAINSPLKEDPGTIAPSNWWDKLLVKVLGDGVQQEYTNAKIDELIDQASFAFACGPAWKQAGEVQHSGISRPWNYLMSKLAIGNVGPRVESPYVQYTGIMNNKIDVVTPRLTENRALCEEIAQREAQFYAAKGAPGSTLARPNATELLGYAYDNMNPALYHTSNKKIHLYAVEMMKKVQPDIDSAFGDLRTAYQELVREKLKPELIRADYFSGCSRATGKGNVKPAYDPFALKDDCQSHQSTLRVPRGVFNAYESELRLYLRGLFSISGELDFLIQGSSEAKAFKNLAESLISDFKDKTSELSEEQPPDSPDSPDSQDAPDATQGPLLTKPAAQAPIAAKGPLADIAAYVNQRLNLVRLAPIQIPLAFKQAAVKTTIEPTEGRSVLVVSKGKAAPVAPADAQFVEGQNMRLELIKEVSEALLRAAKATETAAQSYPQALWSMDGADFGRDTVKNNNSHQGSKRPKGLPAQ